jgi:hypothetical protein
MGNRRMRSALRLVKSTLNSINGFAGSEAAYHALGLPFADNIVEESVVIEEKAPIVKTDDKPLYKRLAEHLGLNPEGSLCKQYMDTIEKRLLLGGNALNTSRPEPKSTIPSIGTCFSLANSLILLSPLCQAPSEELTGQLMTELEGMTYLPKDLNSILPTVVLWNLLDISRYEYKKSDRIFDAQKAIKKALISINGPTYCPQGKLAMQELGLPIE